MPAGESEVDGYRKACESLQTTPEVIGSLGIVQVYALTYEPPSMSAAEQLDVLNLRRAKQGLPPIKPRDRTPKE